MTDYTADTSKEAALVGSTVANVTLAERFRWVTVTNVTGTSAISFVVQRVPTPITGVSLTTDVATVIAQHAFAVGEVVTVAGLTDTTFNGTFTITAVSATGFSYAVTHADIAAASDAGTASLSPTVGGDGTHVLAAVAGATRTVPVPNPEGVVEVSLISAGTPTFSVEGADSPEEGS